LRDGRLRSLVDGWTLRLPGFRFETREQYSLSIIDVVQRSSQPTPARRELTDPSGAIVVAFREGDDPPLSPGNVMQGTFWLVGHVRSG